MLILIASIVLICKSLWIEVSAKWLNVIVILTSVSVKPKPRLCLKTAHFDRYIFSVSTLSREPSACVSLCLSEPARSTRLSWEVLMLTTSCPVSFDSSVMVNTACERDDSRFIEVDATRLFLHPIDNTCTHKHAEIKHRAPNKCQHCTNKYFSCYEQILVLLLVFKNMCKTW